MTRLLFALMLAAPLAASANTSYNLGGVPTAVQLQVLNLHKDAELIGMTKTKLEEAANAALKKAKIRVGSDGKLPGIVVKVTTFDIGPRVASHVSLELKELARLSRLSYKDHPRFVTSWSKAKMVVSEPTKHEAMVVKGVTDLIETFVVEAHE